MALPWQINAAAAKESRPLTDLGGVPSVDVARNDTERAAEYRQLIQAAARLIQEPDYLDLMEILGLELTLASCGNCGRDGVVLRWDGTLAEHYWPWGKNRKQSAEHLARRKRRRCTGSGLTPEASAEMARNRVRRRMKAVED